MLLDALRKRPSHIRTNSADSALSAAMTDLSSMAMAELSPSLSPTTSFSAVDLASLEDRNNSFVADTVSLRKLNGTLLAALRAERARSRELLQKLEPQPEASEKEAAPPSVARARSTDAIRSAADASASQRPTSAVPRLRGPLRQWTSNSNNEQQPVAMPIKVRKPPKRSRVVVDPLGAPLRAGSLVEAHDLALTIVAARGEAPEVEDAIGSAWPEPPASPPCRGTKPRAAPPAAGLSAGLAARLRRALSDELQRVQEVMQTALTAGDSEPEEKSIASLTRRLGWLRSDLTALASHEGASTATDDVPGGSESFCSLAEVAHAAEDFAISLRTEIKSSGFAAEERRLAVAQCEHAGLTVHEIAHDGDCLFACAHKWLEQTSAAMGDAAADAVADVAGMCTSAAEVRNLVVDLMRERASGEASAAAGLLDTALASKMAAAVAEAARGTASDGTSLALRAGLSSRGVELSAADTKSAACREACLEVYLDTMGRTGIYGERLEIEALSALVGRPVHVYYCAGDDASTDSPMGPREKVVPTGVDADAEPLRLLHLVHERHFTLLTAQPAEPTCESLPEGERV